MVKKRVEARKKAKKEAKNKRNDFAVLSIIFGVIGLFWYGLSFGIFALALGYLGLRKATTVKDEKRCIVGLGLGVISIVAYILGLVVYLSR